jgi:hypothetical protein
VTIAVCLKVHEGVVLAADSASTLTARQLDGTSSVVNVYDNANKIVNLYKGLPLGVITWGGGAIGPSSITTIYKDLRRIFTGEASAPDGDDWTVKPDSYQVSDVADRTKKYIYEHLYQKEFKGWSDAPAIGMIVAGYSSSDSHAEVYQIEMSGEGCPNPVALVPGSECGLAVGGQPEAISRLIFGADPRLSAVLEQDLGVPHEQAGPAVQVIQQRLTMPVVQDAMPFQDALDLGEFLVDLTIRLTRFAPGAPTVGGPIEVAGITKHEGFKWVKRKYYYPSELNPRS